MKVRSVGLVLILSLAGGLLWASQNSCRQIALDLKLPVKLKNRGKPAAARWDQVDRILTRVYDSLQGIDCRFRFEEIFRTGKEDLYFPVTNNLIRIVPEESLKGLSVYSRDGSLLGSFENRVTYERSGDLQVRTHYRLYYFQFRDPHNEMQSSGNRLLVDIDTGEPLFLFRWSDLVGKTAISTFHSQDSAGESSREGESS